MPVRARPLSPHLQVYRWQMGNTLSILHRFTGIALALGLAALSYWLMALAGGERSYGAAMRWFTGLPGLLAIFVWTYAFMYHLLNGVRHLFWDAGYGFERTARQVSGWSAVLGALILATAVCAAIWHGSHR